MAYLLVDSVEGYCDWPKSSCYVVLGNCEEEIEGRMVLVVAPLHYGCASSSYSRESITLSGLIMPGLPFNVYIAMPVSRLISIRLAYNGWCPLVVVRSHHKGWVDAGADAVVCLFRRQFQRD